MRFRQSSLKTWMACPLQAKFNYVDHLPRPQGARASFGTVVHAALEHYNKNGGDLDGALDLFRDNWDHPEKLGVVPDYWEKYTTFGELREKGQICIRNYHESVKWEERTIVACEHHFLVPFGEHELEGTVDLLEVRYNGKGKPVLRVCDFKTVGKQPTKLALRYDLQFSCYLWAVRQKEFWLGNGAHFPAMFDGERWWEELRDVERRGIWIQLFPKTWRGDTPLHLTKEIDAGERGDEDFERVYRQMLEIERALQYKVFVPDISHETCIICPYTEQCGIKVPEAEKEVDEEGWF